MYLDYVPPDAPSLITSTGVLFAPKSIYKISLLSNTELFRIVTASFLLAPHKIYLRPAPFMLNNEKIHLP